MDQVNFLYPIAIILFLLVMTGLFTVKQQTSIILERLGKFQGIKGPGLHLKIPLIDRIAGGLI